VIANSLRTATAKGRLGHPALEGDHSADVVVIGAACTGLSVALHLAEAGARVIVRDAQHPGWPCAAHTGRALRQLHTLAADWDDHGGGMAVIERQEMARRIGTTDYLGGVIDRRGTCHDGLTRRQVERLKRAAVRLYPQLDGVVRQHGRGGFVALARDHYPHLHGGRAGHIGGVWP